MFFKSPCLAVIMFPLWLPASLHDPFYSFCRAILLSLQASWYFAIISFHCFLVLAPSSFLFQARLSSSFFQVSYVSQHFSSLSSFLAQHFLAHFHSDCQIVCMIPFIVSAELFYFFTGLLLFCTRIFPLFSCPGSIQFSLPSSFVLYFLPSLFCKPAFSSLSSFLAQHFLAHFVIYVL